MICIDSTTGQDLRGCFSYICPSTEQAECAAHSGFDVCCADSSCPSKFELGQRSMSLRPPRREVIGSPFDQGW